MGRVAKQRAELMVASHNQRSVEMAIQAMKHHGISQNHPGEIQCCRCLQFISPGTSMYRSANLLSTCLKLNLPSIPKGLAISFGSFALSVERKGKGFRLESTKSVTSEQSEVFWMTLYGRKPDLSSSYRLDTLLQPNDF